MKHEAFCCWKASIKAGFWARVCSAGTLISGWGGTVGLLTQPWDDKGLIHWPGKAKLLTVVEECSYPTKNMQQNSLLSGLSFALRFIYRVQSGNFLPSSSTLDPSPSHSLCVTVCSKHLQKEGYTTCASVTSTVRFPRNLRNLASCHNHAWLRLDRLALTDFGHKSIFIVHDYKLHKNENVSSTHRLKKLHLN